MGEVTAVPRRRGLRLRSLVGIAGLAAGALSGCRAAGPPPLLIEPLPAPVVLAPAASPPTPDPPPAPVAEAPAPPPLAVALPPPTPSEAGRLVAEAEKLAQSGQPEAARDTYQLVVRYYPTHPERARALYELGRLLVDPASAARDYRAAHGAFDQLTTEYPDSRWTPEARAWRAALAELLALDGEATRLAGEAIRLEGEANRLEGEANRLEGEANRLKEDMRRLKRLDLDLEKRR